MIKLNTNLSSLIVQSNLSKSTDALNVAIERMTSGFKINGARDNAAGYSIAERMSSQISSYEVAEENSSKGLDIVETASESLNLIEDLLVRLRMLQEQAISGTYGEDSLAAINKECNSLVDEINRLYYTTEYNGINLFLESDSSNSINTQFIQEVEASLNTTFGELGIESSTYSIHGSNGNIVGNYTVKAEDSLADIFSTLNTYGIKGNISGGIINLTSINGSYIEGELADLLGIETVHSTTVAATSQSSSTPIDYEKVLETETIITDYTTTTTSSTATVTVWETTTSSTTQTSETVTTITIGQTVTSSNTPRYENYDLGTINISPTNKILDENVTLIKNQMPQQFTMRYFVSDPNLPNHCISGPFRDVTFTSQTTWADIITAFSTDVDSSGKNNYSNVHLEDGKIAMTYEDWDTIYLNHLEIYSEGEMVAYIGCYDKNDSITLVLDTTSPLSSIIMYPSISGTQYIQGYSNITNSDFRITLESDDTIQDMLDSLADVGINASVAKNGKVTIAGSEDVYIDYISWQLSSALGLNADLYKEEETTITQTTTIWTTTTTSTTNTETVWTTTTTETTRTETINTTSIIGATGATTFKDLGYSSKFNVTIVTGGSSEIFQVNGDMTLNTFMSTIDSKGLKASLENNVLTIEGNGDSYVMSSELSTALKLGQLNKTDITKVTNTESKRLTYDKDNSFDIPSGFYAPGYISLQVGISGNSASKIDIKISFDMQGVEELSNIGLNGVNHLEKIDDLLKSVTAKQTELGAIQNRLVSALDEISIHYENLLSSRSTIRDADIAEVSSEYIRNQILQQASATLLSAANQSPSIALQLL